MMALRTILGLASLQASKHQEYVGGHRGIYTGLLQSPPNEGFPSEAGEPPGASGKPLHSMYGCRHPPRRWQGNLMCLPAQHDLHSLRSDASVFYNRNTGPLTLRQLDMLDRQTLWSSLARGILA